MQEIKAIIRTDRLQDVVHALHELPNMPGVTVSTVRGSAGAAGRVQGCTIRRTSETRDGR